MTASISLLVLLLSICSGQTQSTLTEVQSKTQANGPAAVAAEVSTKTAVSVQLKELRVVRDIVVEMRGALRYTQDRLIVVEGENSAVRERLGVSEKELAELRERLYASEAEVMNLKKTRKLQAFDLRSVAERLAATKSDLQNLEKMPEAAKVAFSVSLPHGFTETVGSELDLVFTNIITNVGQAYNISTGYFTAPVRGVYYFRFTVRDDLHARNMTIILCRNGLRFMQLNEYDVDGYPTYLTSGLTLQLDVNEKVNLRLSAKSRLYNDVVNHSTFTGFLLFTL